MPTIVGIAGGTASGKTTIARRVVEALGDDAHLISHDRYYRTVDRAIALHPNRVRLHNYDHPDALETALLCDHLDDLRAGRPVRVPHYDYAGSERTPEHTWETVEPRDVIVVDGILILADDRLRTLFDHTVFVTTPDDIRLARRMARDIEERGQRPQEVVDQYLTAVRPMHEMFVAPSIVNARLIIRGDGDTEAEARRVLTLIGRPA